MNLYEIDAAITALVDPETGEISDFDAFDQLSMARDQKIENIALYYKNLVADAAAYLNIWVLDNLGACYRLAQIHQDH